MDAQIYVDRLFQGYEDTPELRDFKEEITINLQERIKELQNNGTSPDKAFSMAIAELGDISGIADQISRQKRNEVISQMYMGSKPPLDLLHVVGYVVSGGVVAFGLIVALMTYFSTGQIFTGLAAMMPFIVLPVAVLVFLGLTQETRSNLPMPWKRALLYAVITAVTLFGLNVSAMLYFMENSDPHAVLGTLIPFVIPGLCVGAFLVLTEQKRSKPWVIQLQKQLKDQYTTEYSDPRSMDQRGLLSGALWLLAIAIFLTLGFAIGFQYSWVTFVFAVAGELLIEYRMRARNPR